jgi:hypothetical protein
MSKRSKVSLYEQIRRASDRDGLSIRELSRRFGVHRRDVRQALESAVPPARKAVERPAPRLDRWKPVIDGWLAEDRSAPRKQRHTARRVWQRLVLKHDAQVGESTLRRYVSDVRRAGDLILVPGSGDGGTLAAPRPRRHVHRLRAGRGRRRHPGRHHRAGLPVAHLGRAVGYPPHRLTVARPPASLLGPINGVWIGILGLVWGRCASVVAATNLPTPRRRDAMWLCRECGCR